MGNTENHLPMTAHNPTRHVTSRTVTCIVHSVMFLCALTGAAQDNSEMVNRLRENTVRIEAARNGFGFITGQRGGYLYIATARHLLVPSDLPGAVVPTTVKVSFFSEQGKSYEAEVLGTHEGDLAVLRVRIPSGFEWIRQCLADSSKQNRGTSVWYIGRRGDWFVPVRPGAIASPPSSAFSIEVDDLRVAPGTSGAPLVADTGIVGMILNDSEDITTAISIDFVERAFRQWNHPWDLTASQGSTSSHGSAAPTNTAGGGKAPIPVDDSLDGTIYTNRTAHFQITVQPGWKLAPELRNVQSDIIAALRSPDQSQFLLFTPEAYTGSLNTYALLAETTFKSKMKNYERLSETPSQLDGRAGLRLVIRGKNPDVDEELKFLVYIIPYPDREQMMRLTFFTLDVLFDESLPTFEKIAATYHSLGKPPEQESTPVAESPGANPRAIEESLDGTNYVNQTAGFRLSLPPNWKLAPEMRKDQPDVVASLTSPDDLYFLLVTTEAFTGSLSTYQKLVEVNYKTSFKDYQEISESAANLDGRKSLRMVWHGKPGKEDTMLRTLVYFIPYEDRVVRLSFLAIEMLFDDELPTFEKIAASYRQIASTKRRSSPP
jgi:Trypsin-like peptidase domain